MEATGGTLQVPTEQVEQAPPGILRVDIHNDQRSPSWHGAIPQYRNQAKCQGDGTLHAKAQSHASDSYARWDGGGAGEGALRETAVCVCSITEHNV